jgi:hypothetical protein
MVRQVPTFRILAGLLHGVLVLDILVKRTYGERGNGRLQLLCWYKRKE